MVDSRMRRTAKDIDKVECNRCMASVSVASRRSSDSVDIDTPKQ